MEDDNLEELSPELQKVKEDCQALADSLGIPSIFPDLN